ncbi:hypothetical protein HDU87_008182 [Geranomyces variabilis]|uniref:Uncharacterized protein n=1 Tax=Geranomyces variabilis TaxID=109894 RepID=A0AAD5TFL2_9FUNG|nr:hypothetical protein HDU87_008182 [Geranomyces variabilis]
MSTLVTKKDIYTLQVAPNADGVILTYDVADRASFLDMLDLLAENQTPTALLGWKMNNNAPREVEYELGAKLSGVFNVNYAEASWELDEAAAGLTAVISDILRQIIVKNDSTLHGGLPWAANDSKYDLLKTQLQKLRQSSQLLRPPSLMSHREQERRTEDISPRSSRDLGVYPMPRLRTPSYDDRSETNSNHSKGSATVVPSPSQSESTYRPNPTPVRDSSETRDSSSPTRSAGQGDAVSEDAFLTSCDSFASKDWKHLSATTDDSSSSLILGSTSTARLGFSLDDLIERLTSPRAHDMGFVKVFLMLYRKFMRPSELLDRLMDRFDSMEGREDDSHTRGGPINAVQLRICNVLIHWCSDYWCDFHSDIMRFTMQVFLEICSSRPAYAAICQKLGGLVFREPPSETERQLSDWGLSDGDPIRRTASDSHAAGRAGQSGGNSLGGERWEPEGGPTSAISFSARPFDRRSATSAATSLSSHSDGSESVTLKMGTGLSSTSISFLELDNEDIARQLNILEAEIFSRIKPRDLLQHIWSRTYKGQHAASVAASIGHFNFISSWVTTRILAQRKVKTRAQVLGKFMKIAQVLRNSNNYNTLMAVLAGINSGAVLRLRQTRKFLQERQSYRNHQALEKLMSSDRSFALYRQALRMSELPCIPYLGVFLRDLVYIDENKDKRRDGSINLAKFLLMGDVILMILNFQQVPYDVIRNPYIATLILSQPIMSEEQAYERSLELEPRTASTSPHR